ncbi:sugar transferase [Streptomyces sp. NPDC013953]|uniref:sugar transferase n=1 Tax=Streptomyces sp. NPDC013953 TaxID=3364868 RepID=UPI003701B092
MRRPLPPRSPRPGVPAPAGPSTPPGAPAPCGPPAPAGAPAARPRLRVPAAKRLLDLLLGSALLLLTAPLLAVTAGALALRRPAGGVLLRETRTGLGGHPFTLRRLATRRPALQLLSQLPHVVRGEMSLVGPAPLPPGAPGAATPWRASLRPGLTGLAQARRRSGLPWDEPLLLDQHYVEHHWLGLDLALLLRTLVPAVRASDADHRARGYSAAE